MGLFKSKQERAESKAYKKILKKKTTLATRQAYAEEAVKVARERARAKARQPSLFAIAGEKLREGAIKTISGERRVVARAKPRRSVSIRSKVKTRRVAKRYIRRKRKKAPVRKAPVRKAPAQTSPMSLNQAIYGGY